MKPITITPVLVRDLTLQDLHAHDGVWILYSRNGELNSLGASREDIFREEFINHVTIPVHQKIEVSRGFERVLAELEAE